MSEIACFIDYFPGESGFIIPIIKEQEGKYIIKKSINGEVKKFELDSTFQKKIDFKNEKKENDSDEITLIKLEKK